MKRETANDKERQTGVLRDQIVTIGDLEDFKATLLNEIKTLLQEASGQPTKQWLRSSEVRKMLGISSGTLQNFRVNRTLSYTKVGRIVFYRYDDIAKLLNSLTEVISSKQAKERAMTKDELEMIKRTNTPSHKMSVQVIIKNALGSNARLTCSEFVQVLQDNLHNSGDQKSLRQNEISPVRDKYSGTGAENSPAQSQRPRRKSGEAKPENSRDHNSSSRKSEGFSLSALLDGHLYRNSSDLNNQSHLYTLNELTRKKRKKKGKRI